MLKNTILATAASLALVGAAYAQENYPTKPVTLVVPYAAGGVTDVMARVIADELAKKLGQPFVVENRPGAGGAVGLESVVKGDQEGYALAMMPANLTTMKVLFPAITFDPVGDTRPVVNVGTSDVGIAVTKDVPVNSLTELVEYLKKNPDMSYTSCGTASPQHIAGEYFRLSNDVDIKHINYKGCGAALPDVLAGRIPLFFASIPHLIQYDKTGELNILGIASSDRSKFLPDVPTAVEQGFKDFVIEPWFGIVAPAKVPDQAIAALNTAANEILATDAMKERMAAQNYVPAGGSAEEFGALIKRDEEFLTKVIKDAGITAN
jgi:tripartite-type tricarboxylate transporter receptor subunit TctC